MRACRRDWVVQKCADLRNGRCARNIYGNNTGLDVGNCLSLGRLPLAVEQRGTSCQSQNAQNRASDFHRTPPTALADPVLRSCASPSPKLEVFGHVSISGSII